MKSKKKHTNIDKKNLNFTSIFSYYGTPAKPIFWNLKNGISLDKYLENYPSTLQEQFIISQRLCRKIRINLN